MPIVYESQGQVVICAFRGQHADPPPQFGRFVRTAFPAGDDLSDAVAPTDDWPFLYLSRKIIPADYDAVKVQLKNVISRVEELEQQNQALRGFIIYDEEWHFKEALMYAKLGITPPTNGHEAHISWDVFVERWKGGWRPTPTL